MNKKHKQLDKQIIKQLTLVCHLAQNEIDGFEWLTHLVDFSNVEQSLTIVCVFDNSANLETVKQSYQAEKLEMWIVEKLSQINVKLAKPKLQIVFDSEQACEAQQQGNWEKRLSHLKQH